MIERRQRDVGILKDITPSVVHTRTERSTDLLGTLCNNPPYSKLPDAWEGGFCVDWYYAVPRSFADALDIMLTPKKDKKTNRDTLIWSQGSAFNFHVGYTVHTVPQKSKQPWAEMLRENTSSLQVLESIPAVPAHIDITTFFLSELQGALDKPAQEAAANPFGYEHSWHRVKKINKNAPKDRTAGKRLPEDAEELRVFVPRNAGKITYCQYVRTPDGTAMIPHHQRACTQDAFVLLLITGIEPEA